MSYMKCRVCCFYLTYTLTKAKLNYLFTIMVFTETTRQSEQLLTTSSWALIDFFLINQSRHERSRHRLGMGWTNVHPTGK